MLAALAQHPEVAIPAGLLLLAGLGLAAYNLLYLAPTGYVGMRRAERQFAEAQAEFASAQVLVDSIPQLKARFQAAADKAGIAAAARAKIWKPVDEALASACTSMIDGVGYGGLRRALALAEGIIAQVNGAPAASVPTVRPAL